MYQQQPYQQVYNQSQWPAQQQQVYAQTQPLAAQQQPQPAYQQNLTQQVQPVSVDYAPQDYGQQQQYQATQQPQQQPQQAWATPTQQQQQQPVNNEWSSWNSAQQNNQQATATNNHQSYQQQTQYTQSYQQDQHQWNESQAAPPPPPQHEVSKPPEPAPLPEPINDARPPEPPVNHYQAPATNQQQAQYEQSTNQQAEYDQSAQYAQYDDQSANQPQYDWRVDAIEQGESESHQDFQQNQWQQPGYQNESSFQARENESHVNAAKQQPPLPRGPPPQRQPPPQEQAEAIRQEEQKRMENEENKRMAERKIAAEEEKRKLDERQRAIEENRRAEERQRADEENRRLEDRQRDIDEQRRLEEARRMEESRRAGEQRSRFEELEARQNAIEENRRLEEKRRETEAGNRKYEDRRTMMVEQQRIDAENKRKIEEQRKTEEEKRRGEDKRRAEEDKHMKNNAGYEDKRKADEEKRRADEEKRKADEEEKKAVEEKKAAGAARIAAIMGKKDATPSPTPGKISSAPDVTEPKKPVNSPAQPGKPVNSPAPPGKPVNSPAPPGKPANSSAPGKPVNSPAPMSKPVEKPTKPALPATTVTAVDLTVPAAREEDESLPGLVEQLGALEKQIKQYQQDYQKWYKDFTHWQKQHQGHPDQKQYVDYQKQFQATIAEQQTQLKTTYADLQRKINKKKEEEKNATARASTTAASNRVMAALKDFQEITQQGKPTENAAANSGAKPPSSSSILPTPTTGNAKPTNSSSILPTPTGNTKPTNSAANAKAPPQTNSLSAAGGPKPVMGGNSKPPMSTPQPSTNSPKPLMGNPAANQGTPSKQTPTPGGGAGGSGGGIAGGGAGRVKMLKRPENDIAQPCRFFPKCRFLIKCKYEHPMCKLASSCADPICPFEHPIDRDMKAVKLNIGNKKDQPDFTDIKPGPADKPKVPSQKAAFALGSMIDGITGGAGGSESGKYPQPMKSDGGKYPQPMKVDGNHNPPIDLGNKMNEVGGGSMEFDLGNEPELDWSDFSARPKPPANAPPSKKPNWPSRDHDPNQMPLGLGPGGRGRPELERSRQLNEQFQGPGNRGDQGPANWPPHEQNRPGRHQSPDDSRRMGNPSAGFNRGMNERGAPPNDRIGEFNREGKPKEIDSRADEFERRKREILGGVTGLTGQDEYDRRKQELLGGAGGGNMQGRPDTLDRNLPPSRDTLQDSRGRGDNFPSQGDRQFQPQGDRQFGPQGDRQFGPQGDRQFPPQGDRHFPPQGEHQFPPQGDRQFPPQGEHQFSQQEGRQFAPQGDRQFLQPEGRQFAPQGDRQFSPPRDPYDQQRDQYRDPRDALSVPLRDPIRDVRDISARDPLPRDLLDVRDSYARDPPPRDLVDVRDPYARDPPPRDLVDVRDPYARDQPPRDLVDVRDPYARDPPPRDLVDVRDPYLRDPLPIGLDQRDPLPSGFDPQGRAPGVRDRSPISRFQDEPLGLAPLHDMMDPRDRGQVEPGFGRPASPPLRISDNRNEFRMQDSRVDPTRPILHDTGLRDGYQDQRGRDLSQDRYRDPLPRDPYRDPRDIDPRDIDPRDRDPRDMDPIMRDPRDLLADPRELVRDPIRDPLGDPRGRDLSLDRVRDPLREPLVDGRARDLSRDFMRERGRDPRELYAAPAAPRADPFQDRERRLRDLDPLDRDYSFKRAEIERQFDIDIEREKYEARNRDPMIGRLSQAPPPKQEVVSIDYGHGKTNLPGSAVEDMRSARELLQQSLALERTRIESHDRAAGERDRPGARDRPIELDGPAESDRPAAVWTTDDRNRSVSPGRKDGRQRGRSPVKRQTSPPKEKKILPKSYRLSPDRKSSKDKHRDPSKESNKRKSARSKSPDKPKVKRYRLEGETKSEFDRRIAKMERDERLKEYEKRMEKVRQEREDEKKRENKVAKEEKQNLKDFKKLYPEVPSVAASKMEPVSNAVTTPTVNKSPPNTTSAPPIAESELSPEVIPAVDILEKPGRLQRPRRIVIIIRGLPGTGKSYLAKLIKDREAFHEAPPPRILALDDYFMQETEKTVKVPGQKRIETTRQHEYVYEKEMEPAYRASLLKTFNKTLDEGFFSLVVVDAINNKNRYYDQLWSDAKHKGFEVYIAELTADINVCLERNIHKRTKEELEDMLLTWETAPVYYKRLDVGSLLQDDAIDEVEMEEAEEEADESAGTGEKKDDEDDEDIPTTFHIPKSRWESSKAETLAKLDGMTKRREKRTLEPIFPEEDDDPYDEKEADMRLGKKRVRWADIEKKKVDDHHKKIGFVIGRGWEALTNLDADVPK